MTDDNKRLDESLSIDSFQKSLTGKVNVRPALDRITISETGHVQPKTTPSSPPPASTTGGSGGSSGGSNE
jgi:hypothetical protein